jgi:hypothetical protein
MTLSTIKTVIATIVISCFLVTGAIPVFADEGQAPQINFKVVTKSQSTQVPLPNIWIETFSLTNQPLILDAESEAVHKGNMAWFRYRSTGANGITMFDTLAPDSNDTTPIDIDGDGQTDVFELPRYPQAKTVAQNKNITVDINGKPITRDPKYCMRQGDFRFTKLLTSQSEIGTADCELTAGINFLCYSSPFYARAVPRVDMQGEFKIVGVARNNGEIKPLERCNGEYTQDFGESNNFGACVTADPFGRDFDVVRWGHGNSVANLTFYVEFDQVQPTPTVKQIQTKETDLSGDEWANFACVSSALCNRGDTKCSTTTAPTATTKRVKVSNVARLRETLGIADDKPAYIVECMVANSGNAASRASYSCTTGTKEGDEYLGLDLQWSANGTTNNANYTSRMFDEAGTAVNDRRITDKNKRDEFEWESTTPPNTTSVFMLGYQSTDQQRPPVDSNRGQQQATLSFDAACTLLQDPYGTVFDSVTLEPLANVEVTLINASTQRPVVQSDVSAHPTIGRITNPQITKPDGFFSFWVPDGTYRLNLSKEGYSFPSNLLTLNPDAARFYSELYSGEDIVQKGQMEHRDVPLEPLDKEQAHAFAAQNAPRLMQHLVSIDGDGTTKRVQGVVSHPNATVVLYTLSDTGNKGKRVGESTADGNGSFTISYTESEQYGEQLGILEIVKQNYTKGAVRASVQIEDTPKQVSGRLSPGTSVAITYPFSSKPAFETVVDETGYLDIPAELIPQVPYMVTVSQQNATPAVLTAAEFNRTYNGTGTLLAREGANTSVLGVSAGGNGDQRGLLLLLTLLPLAGYSTYRYLVAKVSE